MLIATNDENKPVYAEKGLTKAKIYYCPSCRSPVHLKAGSVTRAHFAHYKEKNCDVFSEGETEEHIKGKLQLKQWLEQQNIKVEMEAYLPQLNQRPDLLITLKQRNIALEFQCSPIAIAKVVERTEGYLKAGYEVIWILGEKFKYNQQLTAFQKGCLTNLNNELVLFHYLVSSERLEYRSHFTLKQSQKMTNKKRRLSLNSFLHLNLKKGSCPPVAEVNIEIEHRKLVRQLYHATAKRRGYLELLYENNETLVSMPKEVYRTVPSEWMLQDFSFEWKLKFILWLDSQSINTVLTKKKIQQWMQQLPYYQSPQLTQEQKIVPLLEFITILTESNVLKQIRFDKWTIRQQARRYKYLEDKFI